MAKKKGGMASWIIVGIAGLLAFLSPRASQLKSKVSSVSESINAGHELSDANSKALMWFGISLFLGAVAIQLSLGALFFALRRHTAAGNHSKTVESTLLSQRTAPPEPKLQSNPGADLKIYLDRETHLLSSYGWIDKKMGIARIPIERAMDLFASRSKKETRGSND